MKEKEQAYEGQRTKVWQNRDREQDWNRTRREPVTGKSGHRDVEWNRTVQAKRQNLEQDRGENKGRTRGRTGVRNRASDVPSTQANDQTSL